MSVIDDTKTTFDWQKSSVPIAILPVGACEQHGAHLPLNTDSINATYFARYLAEETGASLLPTLPIFTSYEHTGFRGSISFKPETAIAVIRDIVDELEQQNFTRLVILNGHGGNFVLAPTIRDINRQNRSIKIIPANFWEYDKSKAGIAFAQNNDFHSGGWETSIIMAIAPEAVGDIEANTECKLTHENAKLADLNLFGVSRLTSNGIWGDCRNASLEAGNEIVASIKQNMLVDIQHKLEQLDSLPKYEGQGSVVLSPMSEYDLAPAVELCRMVNWNQLDIDWKIFYQSSQTSCIAARHNGRVCGTAMSINYNNQSSWIGMVIVNPNYRRMGIATKLLNQCIDDLKGCACIKLDATPDGRKVYEKLGFKDEYMLARYKNLKLDEIGYSENSNIRQMTKADVSQVAVFDKECFGVDRLEILQAVYDAAPELAYIAIDNSQNITGYTFGRHGFNFEYIGPVNAAETKTAEDLLKTVLSTLKDKAVGIDILQDKTGFESLITSLGFTCERPFIRMYRGTNVPGSPEKEYAILGPELG